MLSRYNDGGMIESTQSAHTQSLYLNVLQLIWYYTLLLFTTFLLQVTSTFFTVLYFTTSYHIFTASYHHRLIKNFKKNLPKITTIYCNDTAIYNNNLLHLILLQAYFRLFQHRNTDYILLQFYYNLLHSYCILLLYYFLLHFYCKLPNFTGQVGP